MGWRCWFTGCHWIHHMNVVHETREPMRGDAPRPAFGPHCHPAPVGLYQCAHCKTISIGAARSESWSANALWRAQQNEPRTGFWEKVWSR